MKKIRLGTNDDGSPLYHYEQEDPKKAVVFTGPISGPVTLPDGTVYDVTEPFIEVEAKHALKVSDAIGKRHETEGHPLFLRDPLADDHGFVHVPSTRG